MSEAGYTIKADLWSLGISLIEIAANKHPFTGVALLDVLNQITDETFPPPSLPDDLTFSNEFRLFVNYW